MKKIALPLALGLAIFVASLVGTYMVVPRIAPEVAQPADSLAAPDALALSDTAQVPPPLLSEAGTAPSAALRDSVRQMQRQLEATERALEKLRGHVEALRRAAALQQDQRTQAEALSSTLGKLEDREMQAILQRIDLDVIALLYAEASSRNRVRLLKALPSERAARFVQQLAHSKSATPS